MLPIIMVTGDATQPTLAAGLKAGVHDFIAKPMASTTVVARIERTLIDPVPFVRRDEYFGPDRAEMVRRHKARLAERRA
jgi:FixJ family two-component response regulator